MEKLNYCMQQKLNSKKNKSGGMDLKDIPDSEFTIKADLVLLAMGSCIHKKRG